MQRRRFLATTAAALGAAASGATLNPANAASGATIRKALVLSMIKSGASVAEKFAIAREAGFAGVEVYPIESERGIEDTKNAIERTGLIVHSIMNQTHWKYPLSSADPEVVKTSLKGLETSLRTAKALGAEVVLLVPGVVTPEIPYEDCFERSTRAIKTILPLAEELGIVIAVENVWNRWLLSPVEFRDFVDQFQSEYLQAYFDVGNIVEYGYPEQWIRHLGSRIKKLHVKGYDRRKRAWSNLLDGTIDWKAVRGALDEIEYDGWMTAELGGGDAEYLADISRRMDKIIAGG